MPTDPAPPSAAQPSAPATTARPQPTLWLTALVIALLWFSGAVFVWHERQQALQAAEATAARRASRLAQDLEQSLALALRAIEMGEAAARTPETAARWVAQRDELLAVLALPFALESLAPPLPADTPAGRWQASTPTGAQPPALQLLWRAPAQPGANARVHRVTLSGTALQQRLEQGRALPRGATAVFRRDADGQVTVLARAPFRATEAGTRIGGWLAQTLSTQDKGVFATPGQLDGIARRTAYQRLAAPADQLVVAYGFSVDDVLADGSRRWPWMVLLAALLSAGVGWGGWRLDRSLRAQARSERHFQTLSDHLPDVVVRYAADGRVLYANPAVEAATGLRPEAMIGRRFEEFGTPPETAALWMACIERVLDSGQPETLQFSYPGPQGERHWESRASLEPGHDGEAPTVLVISRNITARVEAEQHRRTAQQLFETVFQAAPEAMSISDLDSGRLLLVNDAFCALFGRPRDQLVGHSATELGLWQPASVRQELLERLARGEQVRDAHASSTRPDGQPIHVRYSAERVQHDGQDRLLLMFRDVTQLESDQRALARSEQRFRLAAAHGQVWEWDFARGIVQPSDEFFLRLGHPSPPPEHTAAAMLALLHPDDLPHMRQAMRRFLKGEPELRIEYRARDAQGHYRWFDTRGGGLRDASGHVTYMAGTTFDISDRKALEEAQRQTLKHLDTVANASAALAWTVDAQQHPDWLNQAWLDFTGRDLASECEAFWLDDVHPLDRERCAQVFNRAFEGRKPYSMEYRLLRHDGEYRWLHEQGRPRYDADHRFIGYVGSCLDVTDLRRAEAVALERGTILEQVFDVLRDMLFVVDAQERFVFFQAGAEDRLYRKPEDFLNRTIGEVLPPAMVPPLREAMQRAREAGIQELDYSMDLPVGTHHFNARLAWLPGGEQCMFLVRDTTEQQNTQRERERLSRFVLLLFRLASRFINLPVQQMDEAIDEALRDMGEFLQADRAYLFAYDHEAGTATNTHEWCAPGVAPQKDLWQQTTIGRLKDWYQMHLNGERVQVADVQALPAHALRARLEELEVRSLLTLPLMNGPECLGFVGLDGVQRAREYGHEDITLLELFAQMLVNLQLRARAAAQVRDMTDRLEQKVDERTQQLHDSVQRLQAANRELESFNYSTSHDLRTPLRGIEGFSTLLLEEHAQQLDEQGKEYLQRIQRATRHMSQLVSDLLAYSRLQQMTEQLEPVELAPCVRTVLQPFQDELAARQGRVELDIPDALNVRADPQGMAIVLRNLIDNALKFTPPQDAPQLRIVAQAEGSAVQLSVSDRGMGFDMQHHDRIFGMFQRLHRQDQIPGTGIGLALVKKAVERMGGHIRAESATGQGARFFIQLVRA